MTLLVQLVLLAAVALSVAAFWMVAENRRRKRLSTRPMTEFSDWYNLYYGPESGLPAQKVESIIKVISRSIGVQATLLKPTDRFDRELSIPEAFPLDDTIDVLQESLSEAFNTSITIYPEWRTVDDVIRGIVPDIR